MERLSSHKRGEFAGRTESGRPRLRGAEPFTGDRISDFYGGWVHKGITGKMKGGESSVVRPLHFLAPLKSIRTGIVFFQHEAPSSGRLLTLSFRFIFVCRMWRYQCLC